MTSKTKNEPRYLLEDYLDEVRQQKTAKPSGCITYRNDYRSSDSTQTTSSRDFSHISSQNLGQKLASQSDENEKRARFVKARQVYKEILNNDFPSLKSISRLSEQDLYSRRAELQATAYKLMRANDPTYVIKGAELYHRLGKGKKIVPYLLKRIEELSGPMPKDTTYWMPVSSHHIERVKEFIKEIREKTK
ncbi:MAG: hypothetical protein QXX55_01605 [Candidatus Pacearchaeota archaeon]